MKYIRNLFILSLLNFVLIVGILTVSDFAKNSEPVKPIPITPQYQVIPSTPPKSITKTANPSATPSSTKKTTTSTIKIQNTPNPTPTVDQLAGKCIIYISGVRYDMTDFRVIHSGGDIFQCGTDMTSIFNGQHPSSYINQIAKYRI